MRRVVLAWLFELGFKKIIRLITLSGRVDFEAVFSLRITRSTHHFRILVKPNGSEDLRFGQVVGRKICRRAVGRNYMRRFCREWVRNHLTQLSGLDVVLVHRKIFTHEDRTYLYGELECLTDFSHKCRDSYSSSSARINSA
ncbi:ribonuclease P protein component [Ferrovum myxofaciens]|uniref:Ribonuclease P protein component n=1 Tax=Ferrovum myxofaciens TaxID=416213 RepID=A0A9E6SWT7_9PROT|nr:MAG: ribonuclease P protein component [Ferrovum myxofaciens]QWY73951.1 MAG: ribonuclease P protein component [Ferrovum myxofaciens]QWY76704.1 MAG: ribonuclease P protein component [Ferrovum myxofaciens]